MLRSVSDPTRLRERLGCSRVTKQIVFPWLFHLSCDDKVRFLEFLENNGDLRFMENAGVGFAYRIRGLRNGKARDMDRLRAVERDISIWTDAHSRLIEFRAKWEL